MSLSPKDQNRRDLKARRNTARDMKKRKGGRQKEQRRQGGEDFQGEVQERESLTLGKKENFMPPEGGRGKGGNRRGPRHLCKKKARWRRGTPAVRERSPLKTRECRRRSRRGGKDLKKNVAEIRWQRTRRGGETTEGGEGQEGGGIALPRGKPRDS